jgi:hypothetical protein
MAYHLGVRRLGGVGLWARAALLALCLSCGPSFHAIYEGNARFEHCYALEEDGKSAMQMRADCWREWSEHYTYGQTRDRIQYATARYVALTQAPNVPTDEALMMAAPGEMPRVTTITAPAPSNAFAPPPKTLEKAEAGSSEAPPSDMSAVPQKDAPAGVTGQPPAALPGMSCADSCGATYRGCAEACGDKPDSGARSKDQQKACQVCDRTYRTCMRGCFK